MVDGFAWLGELSYPGGMGRDLDGNPNFAYSYEYGEM